MNRFYLLLSICLSIFFSLFLFQTNHTTHSDDDALEDSEARIAWEKKLLADPSTHEIPKGIRWKEMEFYQSQLLQTKNSKYRSANWRLRGPWNVGGRTRAIAVDIADENHIICGGVSGGLWESKDAGDTWEKVSDALAHPGIVSITQDTRPGHTHIWYALSGEIYGTSASASKAFYLGDGAFRSLDNGHTWTSLGSTASGNPSTFSTNFQGGWRIVSSPIDTVAACVYMATYGAIYRSKDTGNTWSMVLGNSNSSYFSDVQVDSKGIVYACLSSDGNTKGFFRSADGVHFTNITPSSLKSYDRSVLGINPNNENEVYFLSELPSDTSGGITTYNYENKPEYVSLYKYLYLKNDGSGSDGIWQNLSTNLPIQTTLPFDKFNCQGGYDLFVKVQPQTNVVFIGGTNIYRSTDGFTSLNNTKQIGGYGLGTTLPNFTVYPNHHPDQHDLLFLKSSPEKAYSVSDGGVKFCANINAPNVMWTDKSLGYITSQLYTITIDENTPYDQWLLGGFQDNGNFITYSNDQQAHWRMTINGDGAYNSFAPNKEYAIISTQLGNVRKALLDSKGNVLKRKRIDPDGFDKSIYSFINPIVMDYSENHTLYMPIAKRIARLNNVKDIPITNDNNKLQSGWTLSDSIASITGLDEISTLCIAPSNKNVIYVGTSNKNIYRIDNARHGDLSMDSITNTPLPNGGYLIDICVDPDDENSLLVCYSNYNIRSLYYSNNAGQNWYYVGGNLESALSNNTGTAPSVRCVEILKHPDGHKTYFAGTSVGLYSTDTLILASSLSTNKTEWTQEASDMIGAAIVSDIKVRHADGYVAVATHGNGIYESYYFNNAFPISTASNSTLQIYPNPSKDVVHFTFSTVSDKPCTAYICNIFGQKIKSLFNDTYQGNTFTLQTDIRSLASGRYYIVYHDGVNTKPTVQQFIKY
ncbi:MAG: T9SS type A sorting domain-containing protein [Chitinophagaceae bacterium]